MQQAWAGIPIPNFSQRLFSQSFPNPKNWQIFFQFLIPIQTLLDLSEDKDDLAAFLDDVKEAKELELKEDYWLL